MPMTAKQQSNKTASVPLAKGESKVKGSFYISPDVEQALHEFAAMTRQTKSEIVEAALRVALEKHEKQVRRV